jgi:GT2 family glycosyltransferase
MDDDCVPEPTALEKLVESKPYGEPGTGLLASLVLWTDGQVHRMNAPWIIPATRWRQRIMPWDSQTEVTWLRTAATERCVRVRQASFVSALIHRRAVEAVGLPLRGMFIWHDDAEYTQRIAARFSCYLVLDSIVTHRTERNSAPDFSQPVKYRYSIRNMIVTLRAERVSCFLKWGRIAGFSLLIFLRVLTFRLRPSALYWLARGFTFNLTPDRVQGGVAAAGRSSGVQSMETRR